MSLKDQLDNLPEGIESTEVKELRLALMRLQKKLAQTRQKVDDLVEATHNAAYAAQLTAGKIPPIPSPKVSKGCCMDKLKQTGLNLGSLFNSRCRRACLCKHSKQNSLT